MCMQFCHLIHNCSALASQGFDTNIILYDSGIGLNYTYYYQMKKTFYSMIITTMPKSL